MAVWKTLLFILILASVIYGDKLQKSDDTHESTVFKDIQEKEINKHFTYPPCQACRKMIESFNKGLANTHGKAYDGGNTKWEEENLPKYSKSQLRLVEILENICTDLDRGSGQCHSIAEEAETELETWWSHLQDSKDVFDHICIDSLKRCCPFNHYGPDCKPCPGYPGVVCSNNGKCKGNGTRKGNGACACDDGYTGEFCEKCSDGFYRGYESGDVLLCVPCHPACDGSCKEGGPKACSACKPGYILDLNNGCVDINECYELETTPCKTNEFCINNDGSYSCLECDRSCRSCDGDGPDMCHECAAGYTLSDNMCIVDETHSSHTEL